MSIKNSARSALGALNGCVFALLMFALQLGAAAIHLWAILIAYQTSGFVSAFLTMSLVGFSEIYWMWQISSATGTVLNNFTLAILGWVCTGIFVAILAGLSSLLTEDA